MRIVDSRNDPHGEREASKAARESDTEIPVTEGDDGTKASGEEPDPEYVVGWFEEEVHEFPVEDRCDDYRYHGYNVWREGGHEGGFEG